MVRLIDQKAFHTVFPILCFSQFIFCCLNCKCNFRSSTHPRILTPFSLLLSLPQIPSIMLSVLGLLALAFPYVSSLRFAFSRFDPHVLRVQGYISGSAVDLASLVMYGCAGVTSSRLPQSADWVIVCAPGLKL
jgi:hypothetical protein